MLEEGGRLTKERLVSILESIDQARICLIGDLCLDAYWLADMRISQLSRETPHFPLPIVEERFSPGGAGNVACNIAALRPKMLRVVGLIGEDWRGDALERSLYSSGVSTDFIVRDAKVITNTYVKPIRIGISNVKCEDPRLDFEMRAPLTNKCEEKLLSMIQVAATDADVICVSDQMQFGCITKAIREYLCSLGKEGKTIVVDSRDRIAEYHHVIVKPNEIEATTAFANGVEMKLSELSKLAVKISCRNSCPAIITLGANGCLLANQEFVTHCPAYKTSSQIDPCGAGDTFLSGFACMLAGGASLQEAAQGANCCSTVTVQKIGTTGTATREEVLNAWR